MKPFLILVLLLLLPYRAYAQAPDTVLQKITHISIAATASLEGGDLGQSLYALGKLQTADERKKKELNLLYAPFDDKPLLTGMVKAGGSALSGYLLAHYAHDHPKLCLLTSVGLNSLYLYVVSHNARVTRTPQ
jgi:hypothetical protein